MLGEQPESFFDPGQGFNMASLNYKFICSNYRNYNNGSSNFTATQGQSDLMGMEHPLGTKNVRQLTLPLQQRCLLLHPPP